MSKLDELIEELCPDGVDYLELKEISSKIVDGMHSLPKGLSDFGKYPVISAQNIYDNTIDMTSKKYANQEVFDKENSRTDIKNGDVLLTIVGAIGRTAVVSKNEKMLFQRSVCIIKPNTTVLDSFYLKYVIDSSPVQTWMLNNSHGAAQKGLYLKQVERIKIPVPPLEIQREIVRILDEYTAKNEELIKKLEEELEARRKQYEYYRRNLLSFGENVNWKTLGDIGKVSMCKRIMKNETSTEGDVPFYKIGTFGRQANAYISNETFKKYKSTYSYPKTGDILISAAGTIGRTVVFDGKPAYFQDSNIVWLDNDETQVLNEFLYYWYQTNPWKISSGGTIARLYNENITGAKVPVMPIDIQRTIVSTLNSINKAYSCIFEELLAEIEARQKQYEYYRDKLLTFKEKVS